MKMSRLLFLFFIAMTGLFYGVNHYGFKQEKHVSSQTNPVHLSNTLQMREADAFDNFWNHTVTKIRHGLENTGVIKTADYNKEIKQQAPQKTGFETVGKQTPTGSNTKPAVQQAPFHKADTRKTSENDLLTGKIMEVISSSQKDVPGSTPGNAQIGAATHLAGLHNNNTPNHQKKRVFGGPRQLTVLIKRELRRMGCYNGRIDSNWNIQIHQYVSPVSLQGLTHFHKPNLELLKRLENLKSASCNSRNQNYASPSVTNPAVLLTKYNQETSENGTKIDRRITNTTDSIQRNEYLPAKSGTSSNNSNFFAGSGKMKPMTVGRIPDIDRHSNAQRSRNYHREAFISDSGEGASDVTDSYRKDSTQESALSSKKSKKAKSSLHKKRKRSQTRKRQKKRLRKRVASKKSKSVVRGWVKKKKRIKRKKRRRPKFNMDGSLAF